MIFYYHLRHLGLEQQPLNSCIVTTPWRPKSWSSIAVKYCELLADSFHRKHALSLLAHTRVQPVTACVVLGAAYFYIERE